jgi:hypothetical protein
MAPMRKQKGATALRRGFHKMGKRGLGGGKCRLDDFFANGF